MHWIYDDLLSFIVPSKLQAHKVSLIALFLFLTKEVVLFESNVVKAVEIHDNEEARKEQKSSEEMQRVGSEFISCRVDTKGLEAKTPVRLRRSRSKL